MIEAAFPLLGASFVVLAILPGTALLIRALMALLEHDLVSPLRGLNARFLLLTTSSALPVAWFCSAGVHQVEPGSFVFACLLDHRGQALCSEPGLFALVLAGLVGLAASRAFRGALPVRATSSSRALELDARVRRIIEAHLGLRGLRGRVVITEDEGFSIETHGLMWPRVFLGVTFASGLSDDVLASALAHEDEHVRCWDPLRYALLELALVINPFGRRFIELYAYRWRAAYEAHCDRQAVMRGAAPLLLADAIVRAARPTQHAVAALGAHDLVILKFRVDLLLAYAEQPPQPHQPDARFAVPLALGLFLGAVVLPHETGTAPLDALHVSAEHAITYLLR